MINSRTSRLNILPIKWSIVYESRKKNSDYFHTQPSSSSVICQTTGPKPLPKQFLHIVRSKASSFNWQYPLLSLKSSSSFLRLLPRLIVTSICPFIFPSITCFRNWIMDEIFAHYFWSLATRNYFCKTHLNVVLHLFRDFPINSFQKRFCAKTDYL